MSLDDAEVLALHRNLVAIPSVSGGEGPLCDFLAGRLGERGVAVERLGNSLLAVAGDGPLFLLDTHLDTVPPSAGWTRDPFRPTVEGGRVYGLGASDAKASVAAMCAAFLALVSTPPPVTLALALVEGEETKGTGTRRVLAELARRGAHPVAAVVGEPTGLDVAVAQKGLLVLELIARGDSCHAAHAASLGARNAAVALARDLVAVAGLDLGPAHPFLGTATLEPTLVEAGNARNVVPGEARAILDVRTTPATPPAAVVERLRAAVDGEVRVLSDRLLPRETPAASRVVEAARRARPAARLYGSATLSDLVFLEGVPAIKCGPGQSERSHAPDEHVFEEEILAAARFYADVVRAWCALGGGVARPGPHGVPVVEENAP